MTRNGRGQKGEPDLPFTPAGEKDWKSYDAANGDYTGSCLPFGLSRSFNAPNPFQILQSGTSVAFLFEINNWFHTSCRPMAARIRRIRTRSGSATRWASGTATRWSWTPSASTAGRGSTPIGHPHSDALHLTQTFRRTDAEHIAYTVTVDDPKIYTRPWKNERVLDASEGRPHRILVRREQQGSPRRSHQTLDAAVGEIGTQTETRT